MLLHVKDLKTYFYTDDGTIPAVDGVSFTLKRRGNSRDCWRVGMWQKYDGVINIASCPTTGGSHR